LGQKARLASGGQNLAALGATRSQHQTTTFGGHAGAETVAAGADQVRRLVCALHRVFSINVLPEPGKGFEGG
jgi:hypothetical protein